MPPTKAVSQEGREGESAVEAEPLLGDGGGHGSTTSNIYLFVRRKQGKESASNLSASEITQ